MIKNVEESRACPDLEMLAAFVDGRLEGHERAAMVEHLADCAACGEIYAETVALQDAVEAPEEFSEEARVETAEDADDEPKDEASGAKVLTHPRFWRRVAPLAAAATVLLAAGLWLLRAPSPGDFAALEGVLSATAPAPSWTEPFRSGDVRGEIPVGLTPEARAFRLGVRAVDLHAALVWNEADRMESLASEMRDLLEDVDPGYAAVYTQLARGEATPDERLATSRQLTADLAAGLLPVDPDPFELGRFVETARLAAASGDRQHFGRAFRRRLDRFRGGDLPPETAELLARVAATTRGEPDLAATAKALDELVHRGG